MLDRVSIDQVADLPEFKMSTRLVALENTKAIDAAYIDLLQANAEETEHAMVRRLRQRQIIEHEKTNTLFQLASEFIDSGQKVLHFVNFRDTIENLTILHAKAKHRFGRIDGEIHGGEREESIQLFQSGLLDGLIVNMQSGGVGLNLQDTVGDAPRTAILNLTDSATWFKQATGRTYRDGSKSPCRFVVPLVADTVEEQMDQNLTSKFKNLEALTDGDFCP
jgi:SNF2 family DNA or RNA helicase